MIKSLSNWRKVLSTTTSTFSAILVSIDSVCICILEECLKNIHPKIIATTERVIDSTERTIVKIGITSIK